MEYKRWHLYYISSIEHRYHLQILLKVSYNFQFFFLANSSLMFLTRRKINLKIQKVR